MESRWTWIWLENNSFQSVNMMASFCDKELESDVTLILVSHLGH